MRGTPIIRLLLLALFLIGATLLVAKLAAPSPAATTSPLPRPEARESSGVPTFLEATLSSKAHSVVLTPGEPALPPTLQLDAPGLTCEEDITLLLDASGRTRDQVTVRWEKPTQSNFLLLVLEPEGLETKTITLHFPPQVPTVPLNLHWPDARPTP